MESFLELHSQAVKTIEDGVGSSRGWSIAVDVGTTVALGYTVCRVGQANPVIALCAALAGALLGGSRLNNRGPADGVAKQTANNAVDATLGIAAICLLRSVSTAEVPRMVRWLTPQGARSLAVFTADVIGTANSVGAAGLFGASAALTYYNYLHNWPNRS